MMSSVLIPGMIKTESSHKNKQEQSRSSSFYPTANMNRNHQCTYTHTHTITTKGCSLRSWVTDVEPDLSSPQCDTAVRWVKLCKTTETPHCVNQQPHRFILSRRAKHSRRQCLLSELMYLMWASEGQSPVTATSDTPCVQRLWGTITESNGSAGVTLREKRMVGFIPPRLFLNNLHSCINTYCDAQVTQCPSVAAQLPRDNSFLFFYLQLMMTQRAQTTTQIN